MFHRGSLVLVSCFVTFAVQLASSQEAAQSQRSLADLAREARERRQQSSINGGLSDKAKATIAAMNESGAINNPAGYANRIAGLVAKKDFAGLEQAAESARASKGRLPGGGWLLYEFYATASQPAGGSKAADEAWESHLALLKEWESGYPSSPAPKIAIAQAFLKYGGKARGSGYASTVTEEGWQLYGDRGQQALAKLREASQSPTRDPYVYYAIAQLGGPLGMDKSELLSIAEEAYKAEPLFYHTYRQVAYFLLPKWMGAPGDVLRFAEFMEQKLGGNEGAFFYFEAASVINCDGAEVDPALNGFSWEKIKQGYAAMERLYGTSNLKVNRLASMAFSSKDQATAQPLFATIGNNWDNTVWKNQETFQSARAWAMQ